MASAAAAGFSPFTRAVRWLRRMTFLTHRWLGIVLALLMAMWTISGIVMMYVSFPETSEQERISGLQPLDLADCCNTSVLPVLGEGSGLSVEMLGSQPVMRIAGGYGAWLSGFDGTPPLIDEGIAGSIAARHARLALGLQSTKPTVQEITTDQWTVYGSMRAHRPIYKVALGDEAGTEIYVSGTTGEVIQDTTAHERFWNWVGTVPHWLYFTILRENDELWSNVVIYASLLGILLTVTGLYIGIRQYGRGKRPSPYHGWAWFHHMTGLVFGVFTLTWVASGLFSMQPWGWMESEGAGTELSALAARPASNADVEEFLVALGKAMPQGVVTAKLSMQDGKAWAILTHKDGSHIRTAIDTMAAQPMREDELAALGRRAKPGIKIASQSMIREEDSYHYAERGESVILPAWRVIYDDAQKTRLYFDPATSELINKLDSGSRTFRWLHLGLHTLDFGTLIRSRPLWDVVMLPLLLGVAMLCCIGLVIGVKRIGR